MRFLAHFVLAAAIALVIGFGLSYFALSDGRLFGALRVGPWTAWPAVGMPAPDPYTRAYMARNGALQLGQSEGLQFVATSDSEGKPLDRRCRYRIDGSTPVATFWTLAATASDGINIARPGGPASIQSARIARANDGATVVYVAKRLSPRNWLEIAGDGPFSLVLTLYDTAAVLSGFAGGVDALPAILREACS
ncbi:MAG: hypothetical protein JWN11_1767 [Hyphomicrobiales bacterium]|nr:hypothetical protein [Hyphomicrobiales bacterium]